MALSNFTLDRGRLLQVAVPLVLGALGCLLPALTITSRNAQIETVTSTGRLWPAADLARTLDPQVMPSFYDGAEPARLGLWLNALSVGLTLEQIGVVVGVLSLVALLMDEINAFVFWPLHLAGWVLAAAPIPLWLGAIGLRRLAVELALGPAWFALTAAGITLLVLTVRARSRIDSYPGV